VTDKNQIRGDYEHLNQHAYRSWDSQMEKFTKNIIGVLVLRHLEIGVSLLNT